MKKWIKWMLVLCMALGLTITAQAEETMEEVIEEPAEALLATPELNLIQNERGIYLSWNAVEGANRYEIYRKTADEDWNEEAFATAKGCAFTNTTIEYGVKYSYKVKAINTETGEMSEFSNVKSHTVRVGKVENLAVERDTHSSVKITWKKSSPATGYEVYRATSENGTYKKIKTLKKQTTTSCIDKEVAIGETYYYKTRAVYDTNKGSFCEVVSRQVALLPPVMKTISYVTDKSVKISWEESPSAQGYCIMRKTDSGSWKQIDTVEGAATTSYKDTTAKGEYEYSVRAYRVVDGKTYKSNRAYPVHARTLKSPTTKLTQVDGEKAVKLSWEKAPYATSYRIYKKVGTNGSWKCVDTVSKDTFEYIAEIPAEQRQYWKLRPVYAKESEHSYGAYTTEKSVRIYRPKFVTYLDLNYSAMPSNKQTEAVLLGVVNVGSGKMRIYSEGAYYKADSENGRNVHLANVDTGASKKYIDVAMVSGTITEEDIALPLFVVDGDSTTFGKKSEVQFVFRYDGLYYRAYVAYDTVDYEEIEKP